MIVVVTGKPEHSPLPLQPFLLILKSCNSKKFTDSNQPPETLGKSALYLLKLGQQHLLSLLGFMCQLSTISKATACPPVLFLGEELERFITRPLRNIAAQLDTFHPMALGNHHFPDLRNYIKTTYLSRHDYAPAHDDYLY